MDATRRVVRTNTNEKTQLRILLDGRKLFDGGIGVYTRNCIAGLLSLGHSVGVILTSDAMRKASVEKVNWLDAVSVHIDNARRYSVDEYLGLPRRVPVHGYDIFHSPHYTLPFGISIPKIVTVHDVIHLSHAERRVYPVVARALIRSAVSRADAVVTVSEASASQLRSNFGQRVSHKLAVVPNSVSLPPEGTVAAGVERSYFVSVFSTLKKHKGFSDLLLAYSSYVSRAKENALPLILVGQGFASEHQVLAQIESLNLRQFVHVLGPVPDGELQRLYARARALIVASLEEGFCLPVVEAHAAGTPAVVRPVPAIRELIIGADTLARDFSLRALADAIASAAGQEADTTILERAFRQQVSERFAPEVTTERLVRVYRSVLGGLEDEI